MVNSFQNISVLLKSQERRSFLVFEFSGCFLGLCPAASMDERFQKRSLRSFQRRRQCQCLIHFGPAPLVQLVAWIQGIYLHFKNKDEIFSAAIQKALDDGLQAANKDIG